MQFEITDAAAITFAHEFYSALADGYPVDAAVVEARAAIFAAGNDVEWGTPVLYMRSPDGRVFDIEPAKTTQPSPAPPEALKPKATPALQPSQKTATAQSPQTPKPKPSAAPTMISPRPRTLWRNPWLLSLALVTLVLTLFAIFKNLDFKEPGTQIARQAKASEREKLYTLYISEGDSFFGQGKFENAKLKYQDALTQKPDDVYATNRVSECNQKIAEQENETKREELHAQYRDEGDIFFGQGDYAKAKNQYEQARSYKSGDRHVNERIQECINRLMAAQKPKEKTPTGMVRIPAGSFLMGSEDGENDEKPVHKVYIDAFYMDKYEVTVAQYQRFLNANTQQRQPENWQEQLQNPNRPVVNVTWENAKAFADWLDKKLPTEAQWEYAARGGFTGVDGKPHYRYPWGDEASASKANFRFLGLKEVGSHAANGYGLFDMAGNVWEWCFDWYNENYYANSPSQNPKGPSSGEQRVLRGGSWYLVAGSIRCANRFRNGPADTNSYVGFRCVQDVR